MIRSPIHSVKHTIINFCSRKDPNASVYGIKFSFQFCYVIFICSFNSIPSSILLVSISNSLIPISCSGVPNILLMSDFSIDDIKCRVVIDQSSFSLFNRLGTHSHEVLITHNLCCVSRVHIYSILMKITLKVIKEIENLLNSTCIGEIL